MNIIAQVCWFDEPVESLERCIASIEGLCTKAVFLDGRYRSFPGLYSTSHPDQYEAILAACGRSNIELSLPLGQEWESQCEKRTIMWNLAEQIGTVGYDYTLIIDADEYIDKIDVTRVRQTLAYGDYDTAMIAVNTTRGSRYETSLAGVQPPSNSYSQHGRGNPRLMKLYPGVVVGPVHHGHYSVNLGSRRLTLRDRGDTPGYEQARTVDMTSFFEIVNDTWERNPERLKKKHKYALERQRHAIDL